MRAMKLDIGSTRFKADPIHEIQRLQAQGDAVRVKFPVLGKMVATTRAELTEHVLTRSDLFVSEPKNAGKPGKQVVPAWMPRSIKDLADNIVVKDDPDHKRLRGLVDLAFAKGSVTALAPTFHRIARERIESLDAQIERQGRADFMRAVSKPVPIGAMVAMLGLPVEDRALFHGWAESFGNLGNLIDFWRVTRNIGKMRRYVNRLVADKSYLNGGEAGIDEMAGPGGLVASLIQAEAEGQQLSPDELTTTLTVLMLAGFETTTHLLNGGMWVLSTHHDVRDTLQADPSKIPAFMHELARWISPFVVTKPRFSAVDQQLGPLTIKQGEYVLPMIMCANYDDRLFDAPGEFRLDRPNANRNMSFGRGIHNCLGRVIARAQAQAVFSQLLQRDRFYTVETMAWAKRPGARNMQTLVVKAGAA